MGKKLAFWGDCNGYGYKIIRILEKLGGINVLNYGATEVTSLYYIDKKNHIKGTYNGDLDKEKYVIMTYQDFITKYPFQVGDIVYTTDNHEEGKIVEILWDETKGLMRYLVDFENTTSWVFVDDIFSYEAKDNSKCGTSIKPMKVKSNAVKLVDGKVVDDLDEVKTMNKKLAIRGHSTRGEEVIELLEMLGGKNIHNYGGTFNECYAIDNNKICTIYTSVAKIDGYVIFTLEEFLEKYPFKVGDKVEVCETGKVFTIGNMIWEDELYTIHYCNMEDIEYYIAKELKLYKETNMNENKCTQCVYAVNNNHCGLRGFRSNFNVNYCSAQNVDKLPNGFELQEDGYFSWVNKKPKYPTTYEECCKVLGYDDRETYCVCHTGAYERLFESLYRLKICRDAYWKIAGEEMGLGNPWKPDWTNEEQKKYCICYGDNNIQKVTWRIYNSILSFPTEEMRDTFYENFKDLIEQCKELL